ncbi:MAG: hypothetical protein ACLP5H_03345 [Desulfomonilaceae bacterium]
MLRIWSWITILMGGLMVRLSPLLHVWQMCSVQSSKGQIVSIAAGAGGKVQKSDSACV